MKRALVLSGGASKIGFQLGVYSRLKRKNFDYIVGNSCGAILGAGLGQGKYEQFMAKILSLRNSDIYEGSVSVLGVLKRVITKKNYLLSMNPLRKLLTEFVRKEDFIIPTYFIYKDKITGELITACTDNLATTEDIIDAIMASSAMPLAMPAVKDMYYDGGMEQVCPLESAMKLQPDEIVIINCFNRADKAKTESNSLLGVASWALIDAMPETIAKASINPFLIMNELVKDLPNQQKEIDIQGTKRTIKYFDYQLFEPSEDLGDSFDFESFAMWKRFCHGVDVGFYNN